MGQKGIVLFIFIIVFSETESLQVCLNFVIISPWKKGWPLIWTNLKSCAKFDWNWFVLEKKLVFFISLMYFIYFVIISTWKKGVALHTGKSCHSPMFTFACLLSNIRKSCMFMYNWSKFFIYYENQRQNFDWRNWLTYGSSHCTVDVIS